MAVRYSPIYSSVWDDDALEGTTFEVHAFFVFLWSNDRIRPSGIYRASDEQLGTAAHLPARRVGAYLAILETRTRIVRDGAWLFVRGYLARQPNHKNLLAAVRQNVLECGSSVILQAFSQRYPQHHQWVADRLATVAEPLHGIRPQSSTEQSSTEQSSNSRRAALPAWVATLPFPAQPAAVWHRLMTLFPGMDHEAVARDAVAYWADHRAKYRDLPAFLRNQFSRAYTRHRAEGGARDPYASLPCAWECPTCGGVHEGPRDGPRPPCPEAK